MKKYQSKYSPDKEITELQYLVEIVCERRADNMNMVLPLKFWKHDEWSQYYKAQIKPASKLIKKYTTPIVLKTLQKNPRIYSLMPKWVEQEIIKEYNKTALQTEISDKVDISHKKDPTFAESTISDNLRNKLD